ncbi:MAG: CAP domain-containing protein, partial [Planctomycetota bacterium]|nr:CAP domain-containing protein [Planctomycetota bacterium]
METGTSASHNGPRMETLEARELLAAGGPSAYAQYLLELINRARANPAAEAARYSIALNEGLAAGTISTSAKGPLAFNQALIDAAVAHETWMFQTELFQHTGMNGSTSAQRIAAAGYVAVSSGENIGVFEPGSGLPNMISDTAGLEESLFVDTGDAGRADRLRLMDSGFREVGIGVLGGPITGGSAIAATEDFASAGSGAFLTGVVYDNRLALLDDFYTPGEGLGDVIVTAVKHGGGTFTTTTWNSGGYSLAVPAGIYDMTFSGGSLGGSFAYPNVVVGTSNVKQDFVADNPPPTADLTVTPTPAASRTLYVRPGAAFSLQAVVQNIGNARADGPFDVAIYRSTDATVDATDTQIDTYALASLAKSTTSTATRALTAPALAGTY